MRPPQEAEEREVQNLVESKLDYNSAFQAAQKRIDQRRKELEKRHQKPEVPKTSFGLAADLLLDFYRRYHLVLTITVMIVIASLPLLSLFAKPSRWNNTALSLQHPPPSMASAPLERHGAAPERSKVREDPLKELILRILRGDFESPKDVAAGNFLRRFSVLGPILENLDVERLEVSRRSSCWSEVEGPFKPPDDPTVKPPPPREVLNLRFVKLDSWKLEDLQVLPLAFADKR